MSRSRCAFVNYETQPNLQAAITRFNGVTLRPGPDAWLVCRVRQKNYDCAAGVGGGGGSTAFGGVQWRRCMPAG
ncbi:hypothetical protein K438DRAFT_1143553 [Mycena galopus ATCC 62051]|nr:hypothetical protein K438DRAFT_1143553 [Mycena galopus ATCC 62051]